MEDYKTTDDSSSESDPFCVASNENILQVGNFQMNLGQFHGHAPSEGWIAATDASIQSSLIVMDDSPFESFSIFNEAEFENKSQQDFQVLLKFPRKQQFLLYDVKEWQLFTVRYGRLPKSEACNRLQQTVDKCLRKVQYLSRGGIQNVNGFFLLNYQVRVPNSGQIFSVKDYLRKTAYDGGEFANTKNLVELKSTWICDNQATTQTLYQSLFKQFSGCKLLTASSHHLDFKNVKSCQQFLDCAGGSFMCPSEVPVKLAFDILKQMHDRTWSLLPPAALEQSTIALSSLHCDIDSGILYLKAKKQPRQQSLQEIIASVELVLTKEMKKTQVCFVPSGKLHGNAGTDKPTIECAEGGVFLKMPDPEHMTEVAKSWFWMRKLPDDFISQLRDTMCEIAKEILSSSCLGLNQVGIDFLHLQDSRIATHIPGGILLVTSAFLKLSQTHPDLMLVIETYNGKAKGLVTQVNVASMDLRKAADELELRMMEFDSIFKVVSDLCASCLVIDERKSTISFGFRTVHKQQTTNDNVHSFIVKPEHFQQSANCQVYSMAFIHPEIAPFIQFFDSKSPVVRVQMYLESWSAHKNSNIFTCIHRTRSSKSNRRKNFECVCT